MFAQAPRRPSLKHCAALAALAAAMLTGVSCAAEPEIRHGLQRIAYNHPGLTVDLGAGLWGWPIPYDVNGDGHPDLIVSSGGLAGRGIYYFENTGRTDPDTGADLFRPAVRIGDGSNDITGSILPDGSLMVLTPGFGHPDFLTAGLAAPRPLPVDPRLIHQASGRLRGNQWSHVDFNGNGLLDLVVGMGDWTDYGWDNAYDANGRWVNGPLHGYVFILENTGSNEAPVYAAPVRLEADNRPVDVYGMPSPVFADFRGAGKLDLICGELVDGLTFFANTGTREQPRYAAGRRLRGWAMTAPMLRFGA